MKYGNMGIDLDAIVVSISYTRDASQDFGYVTVGHGECGGKSDWDEDLHDPQNCAKSHNRSSI